MNFRQSATIIALISLCSSMSFAVNARGEDVLDAQIQKLREGKTLTISDTELRRLRTESHDKFFAAAAELYVEQVKWSLISPDTQGGWPFRSSLVTDPDLVVPIYRKIKENADKIGDPIFDYALICPALYLVNEPEVVKILIRLERKDHFLYDQADTNLNLWRDKISDIMRSRR